MRKIFAFVVTLAALFGCTNDVPVEPPPPPPPPAHTGSFLLTLTTPNTDDAALFFELRGPGIRAIRPSNPSTYLFADSSGTSIRGAIFGPLTIGSLAAFDVPDTTKLGDYTASVLEVAGPDNIVRSSLTGYALRIAP